MDILARFLNAVKNDAKRPQFFFDFSDWFGKKLFSLKTTLENCFRLVLLNFALSPECLNVRHRKGRNADTKKRNADTERESYWI